MALNAFQVTHLEAVETFVLELVMKGNRLELKRLLPSQLQTGATVDALAAVAAAAVRAELIKRMKEVG